MSYSGLAIWCLEMPYGWNPLIVEIGAWKIVGLVNAQIIKNMSVRKKHPYRIRMDATNGAEWESASHFIFFHLGQV
jgi:hypothetical protein